MTERLSLNGVVLQLVGFLSKSEVLQKCWRPIQEHLRWLMGRNYLTSQLQEEICLHFPPGRFTLFGSPDGKVAGLRDKTQGLTYFFIKKGWFHCDLCRERELLLTDARLNVVFAFILKELKIERKKTGVRARKLLIVSGQEQLCSLSSHENPVLQFDPSPAWQFGVVIWQDQNFFTPEHVNSLLEQHFLDWETVILVLENLHWPLCTELLLNDLVPLVDASLLTAEDRIKVSTFLEGEAIEFMTLGHSMEERPKILVDELSDLNIVHGGPLDCDFVLVVGYRNQETKIERCLCSILDMPTKVQSWGVVVIDDASSDGSLEVVKSVLAKSEIPSTLVSNVERRFYTRNLYNAVNLLVVHDHTVVLEIDGDDYLPHKDVLAILSNSYSKGALRTFGSFAVTEDSQYDENELPHDGRQPWDLNRCCCWMPLRSFRKSLFQRVPLSYFLEQDSLQWLRMGEDLVVHPKMMELAAEHNVFVPEALYYYDYSGADHDNKNVEHSRYILSKLYRIPKGTWINCLKAAMMRGSVGLRERFINWL